MNKQWRRVLVSAGALLLASAGCSEPAENGSAAPIEAATSDAADFTLPDLNGSPIRLADYRGKTVIVDFWATWCPPCLFQVPELNKLHAAHVDADDVMVIGVAVDVEGAEVVAPWAEEQGVSYQLVLGDEDVAREFGAMGFPTLVVIRPDGEIDSRHVGLIELKELESLVDAVQSPDAS